MKEILKNPLTKYIFGIFIVIFLFFYNTDDVYAKKGVVSSSYGKTETTNATQVILGTQKVIFTDSIQGGNFGEQWFKHGFKYDLMENGISGGTYNRL